MKLTRGVAENINILLRCCFVGVNIPNHYAEIQFIFFEFSQSLLFCRWCVFCQHSEINPCSHCSVLDYLVFPYIVIAVIRSYLEILCVHTSSCVSVRYKERLCFPSASVSFPFFEPHACLFWVIGSYHYHWVRVEHCTICTCICDNCVEFCCWE